MNSYRDTAIAAALEAGKLLKENFGKSLAISRKGRIDLVTQMDTQAEALILAKIRSAFPTHQVLAEESGRSAGNSEFLWMIDPLDGTTNYAHNFHFFCVSIGLAVKGEVVLGVVYLPVLDELFVAEKGKGATLNGQPISISKETELEKSLLATGFPYTIQENPERVLRIHNALVTRVQGIRRAGAAAVDLCYLACGRFDGFWEEGLKPWDTAAGSLIVMEAGGVLSNYKGEPFDNFVPEVVAANPSLHGKMLEVIKASL